MLCHPFREITIRVLFFLISSWIALQNLHSHLAQKIFVRLNAGACFSENKLLLQHTNCMAFNLSCSVIWTYSSLTKFSLLELISSSSSVSESSSVRPISSPSLLGDEYFRRRGDRVLLRVTTSSRFLVWCSDSKYRFGSAQNRRQKVFNRGALRLCGGAWHYKIKINQNFTYS